MTVFEKPVSGFHLSQCLTAGCFMLESAILLSETNLTWSCCMFIFSHSEPNLLPLLEAPEWVGPSDCNSKALAQCRSPWWQTPPASHNLEHLLAEPLATWLQRQAAVVEWRDAEREEEEGDLKIRIWATIMIEIILNWYWKLELVQKPLKYFLKVLDLTCKTKWNQWNCPKHGNCIHTN